MIQQLHILRCCFLALVFLLLNGFTTIESINIDSRFAVINKGFLDGYVPGKWVCFNNSSQVCGRIFSSRKRWSYVYIKPAVFPLIQLESRANVVGGEFRAGRIVQKIRGPSFVVDRGGADGFFEGKSVCFYRQTRLGCGTITKSLTGSSSVLLEKGDPASIQAGDYVVLEGAQPAFRLDNRPRIVAIRQTEGNKLQLGKTTCVNNAGRKICGRTIFQEPDGAVIQVDRNALANKPKKQAQPLPGYPQVPPPPDGSAGTQGQGEDQSGSRYEWVFKSGVESRLYHDPPLDPNEPIADYSGFVQPKLAHYSNNDRKVIAAELFYRYDAIDRKRTHFDIRELSVSNSLESFEYRVGISKVFWGVAESVNLVDIVNQTDLVEDPDGKEKLGQPMLNVGYVSDYGSLSVYALPIFRERTFPSTDSRLGNFDGIDFGNATIQAEDEGRAVDFAGRYSVNYKILDLGLSYFNGTDREPRFVPQFGTDGQITGYSVVYPLLQQFGADTQLSFDNLALKAEGVFRQYGDQEFWAAVGGGEYLVTNVLNWGWDVTLFLEFLYDAREAPQPALFQNDTFMGLQFQFYDTNNTKFVLGGIIDNDDPTTYLGKVELSRRIGEKFEAVLESQFYGAELPEDPLFALGNDSFTKLGLNLYF
jgi:hypothetical protein